MHLLIIMALGQSILLDSLHASLWEGFLDKPEECQAIETIAKTSIDMVKAVTSARRINEVQTKADPHLKTIENEFKKVDGKPLMTDLKAHFEKIKDVTNATCNIPSWMTFGKDKKVVCFIKNFGEFGAKTYDIHQQHCK